MEAHRRTEILARYREHAERFDEVAHSRGTRSVGPVAPPPASAGTPPTARQSEVLQLIADGLSNEEIAQVLAVSLETVKSHVRQLLAKLGASSRAHAVAIGLRTGLVG